MQTLNPNRSVKSAWLCIFLMLFLSFSHHSFAYHFPWDQGHDTTNPNDPNDPGTCEGPNCDPCSSTGSPVYLQTGHFIWTEVDVEIPGRPSLTLRRTYNSNDPRSGSFGNGWSTGCETGLYEVVDTIEQDDGTIVSETYYLLREANGKRYAYRAGADGQFISPPKLKNVLVENPDNTVSLVAEDGTSRTFNINGGLVAQTSPAGQLLSYEYDNVGRLTRMSDAANRFLEFTYNLAGRVSEVTDSEDRSWYYHYDSSGNLTEVVNPDGGSRLFEYEERNLTGDGQPYYLLTKITDEQGVTVTGVTYQGTGVKVTSYTVGQNRFSYTYHSPNSVSKSDSTGSTWTYQINDKGEITSERAPVVSGDQILNTFVYDDDGNITRYIDPYGRYWDSTYDTSGRRTSASNPAEESITWEYPANNSLFSPIKAISPSGRVTEAKYDSNGNITELKDPSGAKTKYTWDNNGNIQSVTDPLGNQRDFLVSSVGFPTQVTDPEGQITKFQYDGAGNLTSIFNNADERITVTYNHRRQPLTVTDPSGAVTIYERDLAGRLLSVTDPAGNKTQYTYDGFGRLITSVTAEGKTTSYVYRSDNLISSITKPDNTVINYGYDAAKRVTSVSSAGQTINYTYNARNDLVTASSSDSQISFEYDEVGRLIAETEQATGKRVEYAFNDEGERISTAAVGRTYSYEYNFKGQISKIVSADGEFEFVHDANGRRTALNGPSTNAAYTYNSANQLKSLTFNGIYDESLSYSYNDNGLINEVEDSAKTWSYVYNDDGFLESAATNNLALAYSYDAAGNLTGNGQVYDDDNKLLEDADHTYLYDERGNLTRKTAKDDGAKVEYAWNGWNKLISVTRFDSADAVSPVSQTTFTYDALGRRLTRNVNGTTEEFVYDGYDLIGILDGAGNTLKTITNGPRIDEPLALNDGTQTVYLHQDHIGSVISATNGVSVLAEYEYGPYGQTLNSPSDIGNPFRFAGREYEADDLYYNRARFYDPTQARFISPDPLGVAGDINLYRYAGNNPIHISDPHGEAIWFAVPIIWGAVEVGLALYDAYDTADTLLDDCKTAGEKWLAGGLFVAGALLPGGGYTAADDILTSKPIKEGIYEFVDTTGKKYVGQSNDVPRRLQQHVDSGKLDPNTNVDVNSMPGSTKTDREIAEHRRIQEITGGVPARQSDKVSNKVDPIGPKRQHLLDD